MQLCYLFSKTNGYNPIVSHGFVLQWRRSIVLGDTLRLLTDAQSVVDVPDRLEQLEQSKVANIVWLTFHTEAARPASLLLQDWGTAVNLLIASCNKLARQELSGVSLRTSASTAVYASINSCVDLGYSITVCLPLQIGVHARLVRFKI